MGLGRQARERASQRDNNPSKYQRKRRTHSDAAVPCCLMKLPILKVFASLRLTVACLALALLLVFVGTLAQVKLGLYTAQSEFFRSVFVYWQPAGSHLRIPVFPGG